MRILAFNYEYPPLGGGGGVVFQAIYDELAKRHQVTIVTSGHADLPALEDRAGQEIHRLRVFGRKRISTATFASMFSYVPASWQAGRQLLAARRFDLINTHFVVPTGPAPQDLADRFRLPNVLSIHGGDIYDPSKRTSPHRIAPLRALVRSLLGRATRVVANSKNIRDNALNLYGVQREIQIVPLGIALPTPSPRDRNALGIDPDRFVMVTIGRLVARKGVDALLEALRRLDDPHDLLVVIGGGPLKEELSARAAECGLADRVRFTGRVDEAQKWAYLAAADLYVSTAMHEGFGLVFLEAMHAGLPIACYDCGGQTDFLEDGVTGAVVPLGDVGAFTAAVHRLRSDPALRTGQGASNHARAADFSAERCAARYEGIFAEVTRPR